MHGEQGSILAKETFVYYSSSLSVSKRYPVLPLLLLSLSHADYFSPEFESSPFQISRVLLPFKTVFHNTSAIKMLPMPI